MNKLTARIKLTCWNCRRTFLHPSDRFAHCCGHCLKPKISFPTKK